MKNFRNFLIESCINGRRKEETDCGYPNFRSVEIYNFKCAKWDGTRYSGKNIYYGEKYLSNVPF